MKIAYDHQIFSWQKYGGISRYFTELINGVKSECQVEIFLKEGVNEYLKQTNLAPLEVFKSYDNILSRSLKNYNFKGKQRLINISRRILLHDTNQSLSLRKIKQKDFDIFHPTYYDTYFLNSLKKPFVLTIYDMIHELFPEYFNSFDTTRALKKKLALKADHILAISENTKKDIIKLYGINEKKVSVVHLASNKKKATKVNGLPQNYILFVGSRNNYKNYDFFIKSISKYILENPEYQVLCIGGGPFSSEERKNLRNLKIEKKVTQRTLTDSELSWAYQKANLFVFPSIYEGFGIPILEAFQNNCPTLLANSSCFKEIASDSATYFEIGSEESFLESLKKILENSDYRKKSIEKGLARAQLYSWEKTSKETVKVYKKTFK